MGEIGKKLWNSWKALAGIVFDWPVVLLLLCVAVLIFYTPDIQDKTTVVIIKAIFAVLTSFLGAVIYKKILESQDKGILVVRGETAIRNLVLLQQNVIRMSSRVAEYLRRMPEEGSPNREATQLQFEEVIEKCAVISYEAANAIESWKDLIPGADLTKRNNTVGPFNNRIIELERELGTLHTKRKDEKDLADLEKKRLQKKIAETEGELREQIRNRRTALTPYMGTAASIATAPTLGIANKDLMAMYLNPNLVRYYKGCVADPRYNPPSFFEVDSFGETDSQLINVNRRAAPLKQDIGEED